MKLKDIPAGTFFKLTTTGDIYMKIAKYYSTKVCTNGMGYRECLTIRWSDFQLCTFPDDGEKNVTVIPPEDV